MNNVELITRLEVGGYLGTINHDLFTFKVSEQRTVPTSNIYTGCFKRAKFLKKRKIMSKTGSRRSRNTLRQKNVNEKWELLDGPKATTPQSRKRRNLVKNPSWFSGKLEIKHQYITNVKKGKIE